jgi:hypothetical protein
LFLLQQSEHEVILKLELALKSGTVDRVANKTAILQSHHEIARQALNAESVVALELSDGLR